MGGGIAAAQKRAIADIFLGAFKVAAPLKAAADFEQFLFDKDYLALPRSEIYPGVARTGGEIYDGFLGNRYEAAFVQAGLGSGKSTMAALLVCAIAHWLLSLPDPHAHLGLLPDKPIVIPCMGPRAGQVKDVVFASISSFIRGGPFFQRLEAETKFLVEGQTDSDVLKLWATFTRRLGGRDREIVKILAGNSVETYPVGMNVFSAVVDELAAFRDSEGKSQAKEIFETLDQRRLSRFAEAPHQGMVICIGTAGHEGGYVDRKLREAEANPGVYVHRARTWEMKGRERYKGSFFHFAKLDLGPRGVQYRCCDDWPPEEDADKVVLHLEDVPTAFRNAAQRDPILFLRDFASVASLAINPWDMNAEVVSRLVNLDREHPLYENTLEPKDWFWGEKGVDYYAHIDLGLGREGGDAAGFCLGHQIGEKRVLVSVIGETEAVYEFRPIIYVDLLLRWTAGERGEILFGDIREFLYKLRERGFDISGQPLKWDSYGKPLPGHIQGGVSFDGWQSIDSIQILAEHGIQAQILSVDKSLAPWEDLRECLHDSRLDYHRYETDLPTGGRRAWFEWEYQHLELVRGKRVDHPENGSKDCADAVAAVVHRITQDHGRQMGGWI